jgi:hypothetical protein
MSTKTENLNRFLTSPPDLTVQGRYVYRFPNGQVASVIPDPSRPLRWELAREGSSLLRVGLTTAEVEDLLTELGDLSTVHAREAAAIDRYEAALARGLSDFEAREEGWPTR